MTSSNPSARLLRLQRAGRRRNRLRRALRARQLRDGIADRATDGGSEHGLAGGKTRLHEGDLSRQVGNREAAGSRFNA